MRILFLVLSVTISFLCSAQLKRPLYTWQDFYAYRTLVASDNYDKGIIAAGNNGLLIYNADEQSINTLSSSDGLNASGISTVKYQVDKNRIFVGYSDGNIDVILSNGTVRNIGDLFRSTVIGNKNINRFYFNDNLIWVCTGIGILIIDENFLIKDTYRFGASGGNINVSDLTFKNGKVYAATDQGLRRADVNNPFLSNFQNWETVNVAAGKSDFNFITEFANKLIVNYNDDSDYAKDELYSSTDNGATWQADPIISAYSLSEMKVVDNKLLLCDLFYTAIINSDFSFDGLFSQYDGNTAFFSSASYYNGLLYQCTENFGLIQRTAEGGENQIMNAAPYDNNTWNLRVNNGKVWVAAGAVNSSHNSVFLESGASFFDGVSWRVYTQKLDENLKELDLRDVLTVAQDPAREGHFFLGTWGYGLHEFENYEYKQSYDSLNSPLEDRPAEPGKIFASQIFYDDNDNLWVFNSFASKPIKILRSSGVWQEMEFSPETGNRGSFKVEDAMITTSNQAWAIINRLGIAVVDFGEINDPSDDRRIFLTSNFGEGGLPSSNVKALVEDNEGDVWIGTDKGIAVFYSPEGIFSSDEINAQQIFIEQDGNVQIVLETEVVRDIEIDGANRKWIATESSGLFLFSADGSTQIAHYTAENSPLVSNTVYSLAIDRDNGELFIATSQGLQSFQTDAKGPVYEAEDNLTIYPNPVRKEYAGDLIIEGMVPDSDVRITDSAGNLVYRSTSNGNRTTWDFLNQRGEAIQSGVYFIYSQEETGEESSKGKVLIMR